MKRLIMFVVAVAGTWLAPGLAWSQDYSGYGHAYGRGRAVACESEGGAYRECRTGFRGPAMLEQNWSQTRCVEGRNWGSGPGMVWVRGGCRGLFVESRGAGWPSGPSGGVLRCESIDGEYNECDIGVRGRVQLSRQLSGAPCVEGRTWGQRGDQVWVSGGCRAEFTVGGGWGRPGNYTVTCSSEDGRTAVCPWDPRLGYPRIVEQLSSSSCDEGYSWGMRGRSQIWVSRGCRARFGPR